jgi:hypothetical protein
VEHRIVELLRAADVPADRIDALLAAGEVEVDELARLLKGRTLLAELGLDTYNGRRIVVVRRVLPAMPYWPGASLRAEDTTGDYETDLTRAAERALVVRRATAVVVPLPVVEEV